jgi:tetratricopeptide (TPR) repeat protein
MKIHFWRFPSGMVFFCLSFIFAGCSTDNKVNESLEPLYQQAILFSSRGDYLKSLDLYNKALALDTLNTSSPGVVKALNEKRTLEGLTGEYYAALKTTARLEKLPRGVLPDSLRNTLFAEKAVWLRELGCFAAAAASLENIGDPSPALRFELASLYQKCGDYKKAARIYRRLSSSESDPVTRMTAYAGLLECMVAQPQPGFERADAIAVKIAAESGRILAMDGAFEQRIQALRSGAKSLQLLEKHRRNASFFLFKALILAEKSRNPFLLQILRLESNAAIVRKPLPFREAAEYFRIKNMQYAQASSLLMLGGSKSLKDEERITALQQGFSVNRYFAPPYPTNELLQLENKSSLRLTGLLLERSRIFELFDAGEQIGNIDLQRSLQIYRKSFSLGKGHEALESEISRLLHEISGLLQRKADIFIRAEGYEKNRTADQALNIKRGRLIELLPEVRVINPVAAEAIQLIPVTLRTVQASLKEDQAIIKPLLSDSLCGVMLIGKRQLQIAGGKVCFDSLNTPNSKIDAIRRELSLSSPEHQQSAVEQEWFKKAFYEPLAGSLGSYKHLVIICDQLFPYHILNIGNHAVPEKRYAFLQSIKELSLLSEHPELDTGFSRIFFYRADNVAGARLQKLLFPRDRVFILWKNYSSTELENLRQQIAQQMQGTVSGSGALFSFGNSSTAGREIWMNISSYGID